MLRRAYRNLFVTCSLTMRSGERKLPNMRETCPELEASSATLENKKSVEKSQGATREVPSSTESSPSCDTAKGTKSEPSNKTKESSKLPSRTKNVDTHSIRSSKRLNQPTPGLIKSLTHVPPAHSSTLNVLLRPSSSSLLSSASKEKSKRMQNLKTTEDGACERSLSQALHVHFEKRLPRQSLALYAKAMEHGDRSKNAALRARVYMNFAKCIEDCVEHCSLLGVVERELMDESLPKLPFLPMLKQFDSPEVESSKQNSSGMPVLSFALACKIYEKSVSFLTLPDKPSRAVRLQLRLAECYEKARMKDKAKDAVKAAEKNSNVDSVQFDVGSTRLSKWCSDLLSVFVFFFCESREKGIQLLQKLVEQNSTNSQVLWYGNLFLARKCILHTKRFYKVADVAYDSLLKVRPEAFLAGLEYAHFLQYAREKPLASVTQYSRSICHMRRNMEWPGVREHLLPEALYNMGHAHLTTLEPELSHPVLTEAISLITKNKPHGGACVGRIQLTLARALEECRDSKGAAGTYQLLVEQADKAVGGILPLQIDAMGRRKDLNAAEIYGRYAAFLSTQGDHELAETYFTKALSSPSIDLPTKMESLDAFIQLLRDMGEDARAAEAEDELFALVRHHNQQGVRLPLRSWVRRLDFLEASNRPNEAEEIYSFLMDSTHSLGAQDNNEILRRYAEHLQLKGRFEEAATRYKMCLERNPLNVHMLVQYAWCMSRVHQPNTLIRTAFEEAIRIYESHPDASRWDGCFTYGEYAVYLHDTEKDLVRAEEMYNKAVSSVGASESDNYAQVCANLAILYHTNGKAVESSHWFTASISTTVPQHGAWQLFLDTLIQSRAIEKGFATAQRMLELFPSEASGTYLRIAKLHELKSPSSVEDVLSSYYQSMLLGCAEKEKVTLEEICTKTSNIHAAAEYAAVLNYRMHRHQDAAMCYSILRRRMPTDSNIALHYGRMLYDHGIDFEGAREQFNTVLAADPGNLFALDFLSDYYQSQKGDLDAAEDCHLQALRLGRRDPPRAAHQYACFAMQNAEHTSLRGPYYESLYQSYPQDASAMGAYAIYMHLKLGPDDLRVAKLMNIQEKVEEEEEEDEAESKEAEPKMPSEKELRDRVTKIIAAVKKAMRKNRSVKRKTSPSGSTETSTWTAAKIKKLTKQTIEAIQKSESERCADTSPRLSETLPRVSVTYTEQEMFHRDRLNLIDTLYRNALEQEPSNTNHLQHYACFLATWRLNFLGAAEVFFRSLRQDPKNLNLLRLVVAFLFQYGYNHQNQLFLFYAEALFKEIFQLDASNVDCLLLYANYLNLVKHDSSGAEKVLAYVHGIIRAQQQSLTTGTSSAKLFSSDSTLEQQHLGQSESPVQGSDAKKNDDDTPTDQAEPIKPSHPTPSNISSAETMKEDVPAKTHCPSDAKLENNEVSEKEKASVPEGTLKIGNTKKALDQSPSEKDVGNTRPISDEKNDRRTTDNDPTERKEKPLTCQHRTKKGKD